MPPPKQISSYIHPDLARRQKSSAFIVRAFLVLTVVLSLVAFLANNHFHHQENEGLDRALRIAILVFGLSSVLLRRTRFSEMRLQDTGTLKGASGLMVTLAATTLQVALLGVAITIFGFVSTVITGNGFYSYGAGFVGFVVLLYGYPTKSAWVRAIQRFAPYSSETQTTDPSEIALKQ